MLLVVEVGDQKSDVSEPTRTALGALHVGAHHFLCILRRAHLFLKLIDAQLRVEEALDLFADPGFQGHVLEEEKDSHAGCDHEVAVHVLE